MIKGSAHQEDIMILNVYSPNNTALINIKQKLRELKGEIEKSTVIVGDFDTLL